jgi:hypothetical protein
MGHYGLAFAAYWQIFLNLALVYHAIEVAFRQKK